MPEQFKQFDFSKEEDQKEFKNLLKENRDSVKEQSEDEAYKIQEKIKSGEAKDYKEAERILEEKKKEGIVRFLEIGHFDGLDKQDVLPYLFNEDVRAAAQRGLEYCLNTGWINSAEKISNFFKISLDKQKASEITESLLSKQSISAAVKVIEMFKLSKESFREVAKKECIEFLRAGNLHTSNEIYEKFSLSSDIFSDKEALEASREGVTKVLRRGFLSTGDELLISKFSPLSEEEFNQNVREGISESLKKGSILTAKRFHEQLSISKELFINEVKEEMADLLLWGRIKEIKKILFYKEEKDFDFLREIILDEKIKHAATEGLTHMLGLSMFEQAIEIKEEFGISSKTMQEAAKEAFLSSLKVADFGKDIIFSDRLFYLKSEFNLQISTKDILRRYPDLNKFLYKIKRTSPEYYNMANQSVDALLMVMEFRKNERGLFSLLRKYPFIIDAIQNNSRFGLKLFSHIRRPGFDSFSEDNINFLFKSKKEIIQSNPETNPESLEFRQLMQEKLKEFKNNPEIMAAIEKQEINLDEWLNYSETNYFSLSTGGSEIAFSEKIRTPIDRIKETIDSYAYTIKFVLKEYRPEMEKYEIILDDAGLVEDQIAKMETALEQARTEGNEKKAQGIEKGLASQKEKLNNLKKGFLWDKLTGEIAAFQRLKNDCFEAQKRLMEAENKLENALSGKMPSGKMIQDIKQSITSSKEELKNKFNDLEGRIEEFKINLPDLISPCLGQERSDALIQEIDQKVAEQFNHFESDRTTVANLFSEQGDKETKLLESRPMSIFVWARNPDIDLYQGNYSPCCICIDSVHMGAESTIADYNTDLGIQIVNIWDETKNEPVTAAWCWLGQNKKGEKALVIDNIESNTLYSSNFSEQLSSELFEYIKEYARKIGVNKVVLGKTNNDLPVGSELAKLSEDNGQYEKIGGSNRSDGYFLEAEEKSVKLVWQAKEKKVVEKKTKEILKVEFKDIKTESVNEKNLAKILQAERKIYAGTGLISGQTMVEDIKRGNGFEYSVAMWGVRPGKKQAEVVAYIVAVEDETDEGDKSIYMEDIAVLPEAQRQGIGWEVMKEFIGKLKAKAAKDNQPVLLDMHLRETSQTFMANHHTDLENLGVKLIEEALVPDYYDEGKDSLYQVYQIKAD